MRWAADALYVVRRHVWSTLHKIGVQSQAAALKNFRYALSKNPEDRYDRRLSKLVWITRLSHSLSRACLFKEQLRLVFQHRVDDAVDMLDAWLTWARRSRVPAFVEHCRRINRRRRPGSSPPEPTACPTGPPRA